MNFRAVFLVFLSFHFAWHSLVLADLRPGKYVPQQPEDVQEALAPYLANSEFEELPQDVQNFFKHLQYFDVAKAKVIYNLYDKDKADIIGNYPSCSVTFRFRMNKAGLYEDELISADLSRGANFPTIEKCTIPFALRILEAFHSIVIRLDANPTRVLTEKLWEELNKDLMRPGSPAFAKKALASKHSFVRLNQLAALLNETVGFRYYVASDLDGTEARSLGMERSTFEYVKAVDGRENESVQIHDFLSKLSHTLVAKNCKSILSLLKN